MLAQNKKDEHNTTKEAVAENNKEAEDGKGNKNKKCMND